MHKVKMILNKDEVQSFYDGVSTRKRGLETQLKMNPTLDGQVRECCLDSIELDEKLLAYIKSKLDELERYS